MSEIKSFSDYTSKYNSNVDFSALFSGTSDSSSVGNTNMLYDWDKITKAVKSFVEDYNDVVKEAGESNTKDVLRNASWMTGMTDKNSNMLAKIGITIGKGNKLELDEDALKQADISSLKTVFTGYNSFVSKISQKATGISNAANRASATYTNNGTYSKTDSSLTSSKIDKEV